MTSKNYGGYCSYGDDGLSSDITIRVDNILDSTYYYNHRVNVTFTHELGHAFDYSLKSYYGDHFARSDEWLEICNQIAEFDSTHELLRDYAYDNSYETFADVVAEYFGKDDTQWNINDLKAIEIDYNGYTNLYDYMTSILT